MLNTIVKAMLHHDSGIALSESDLEFVQVGYYLVDPLVENKADESLRCVREL